MAADPHGILCRMDQSSSKTSPARLSLDELTALALGADPQRLSLVQLYNALGGGW